MPTHTHVFDAHNHIYGHFGTATCEVRQFAGIWVNEWVEAFDRVMDSGKIMTFKLVIKLI
jgi:hypothetical protein